MKELSIVLCMVLSQVSIACSCYYIEDPCDNLINEYSTPVLVEVNSIVGTQKAYVSVFDLTNENPSIQQDYVIIADSLTSCGISIDHLHVGETYFFGMPVHNVDNDTVQYSQCMSPFYEFGEFPELSLCSITTSVVDLFIFPNPIQNHSFKIQHSLLDPTTLRIYDSSGSLVFEKGDLDSNDNQIDLPEQITNGLYFVRIETVNKHIVYSSKFVVNQN